MRIRDEKGRLRATATGGSANVNLAFDQAVRTVAATIEAALASIDVRGNTRLQVACGLAGVSNGVVAARVKAALPAWDTVMVTSDADIACVGAHAGADGGLVIAGTGSGAIGRLDGRPFSLGGRGFLLGDDGSGARLGLEAVRAALRAHDGLATRTPLACQIMARFGDDPVAAIDWGRCATSRDFAALAPLVVEHASQGEVVAAALVGEAVAALAAHVRALQARGVGRISFVGGLSDVLRPHLPDDVCAFLAPPLHDALDGALLLAGCPGDRLASP